MTPFKRTAVSLAENGYQVIPIPAGQKSPGFKGWQNYQATGARIEREWADNGNIGILTARTPAIDIDTLDPDMARDMEAYVLSRLDGDAPIRVGRAPKRLILCSTSEPFRKRDSGFWVSPDGVEHKLEVLGQGQQFVAFGVHPDTKKPYKWVSLEDPRNLDVTDLPPLSVALADEIVAEFCRRAEARGWVKASSATEHHVEDEFFFLRPKPDVSDEEVAEAVRLFPNPGRDYDLWVRVGAALHNHFEGREDGLALWEEWSERSPLYNEHETHYKWTSFGKYTGAPVTVGFLLKATAGQRTTKHVQKAEAEREQRAPLSETIAACEDAEKLVGEVLRQVALARLDVMAEEIMLKEINARRKKLGAPTVSLTALRKKVQDIRISEGSGTAGMGLMLEKALADKVLEMCYASGDHLIYFSDMWWVYRGGVWRRTEENVVASAVQEAVLRLQSEEDELALRLAEAVAESRGDRLSAVVNTIVATIRRVVGQDGYDDPLNLQSNRPPRVVNCTNGELWFGLDGSVTFRKHNPESRLTNQVGCAFDRDAKCPTWDGMIDKVFQKCRNPDEVKRHFYEVMGYLLQPDRHQAMWVMFKGPGGNGKSTLLEVIRSVLGQGAVLSTSIADLSNGANTHFTDAAQGKLMLLDDDFKASALLPDDWLKKFSEAKSITANPKFGRQYNFTARCTPVILTNGWPSTVDLSDGLRRRAVVFETNHVLTAEEKDPTHLARVLESELAGVLNRLLAGLVRVLKRGQRFDPPAECEEAKRHWITMSNPTARFVELVVEKTGEVGDRVAAADVYDAYRQWAKYDEGNIRELGRNKFYDAMESLGLIRRNHSGIKYFVGVKLRKMEGINFDFIE